MLGLEIEILGIICCFRVSVEVRDESADGIRCICGVSIVSILVSVFLILSKTIITAAIF